MPHTDFTDQTYLTMDDHMYCLARLAELRRCARAWFHKNSNLSQYSLNEEFDF